MDETERSFRPLMLWDYCKSSVDDASLGRVAAALVGKKRTLSPIEQSTVYVLKQQMAAFVSNNHAKKARTKRARASGDDNAPEKGIKPEPLWDFIVDANDDAMVGRILSALAGNERTLSAEENLFVKVMRGQIDRYYDAMERRKEQNREAKRRSREAAKTTPAKASKKKSAMSAMSAMSAPNCLSSSLTTTQPINRSVTDPNRIGNSTDDARARHDAADAANGNGTGDDESKRTTAKRAAISFPTLDSEMPARKSSPKKPNWAEAMGKFAATPTPAQKDEGEKKPAISDAELKTALRKATDVTSLLYSGQSSALGTIFDQRHDAAIVCVAVTSDYRSYGQWLEFVGKLGDKAVREACLEFWNDRQANNLPSADLSATFKSRLDERGKGVKGEG